MRITWANHSKRWILVSNVSMTYHGFSESNTYWFQYVWALPQNRWSQLSCILQYSHCTFVTILCRPFARLFVNLAVCIRAIFTTSASFLWLVEQAFWRVPFFTEWIGASSFEVILARPSRHSTTGTFLWDFGFSMHFSLILLRWKNLGDVFGCVELFPRLFISWRKLQLSPFDTLPVGFPLPTIS